MVKGKLIETAMRVLRLNTQPQYFFLHSRRFLRLTHSLSLLRDEVEFVYHRQRRKSPLNLRRQKNIRLEAKAKRNMKKTKVVEAEEQSEHKSDKIKS